MRGLTFLLLLGVTLACSSEHEAEPSARAAAPGTVALLALGRYTTDPTVGADSTRPQYALELSADSLALFESASGNGERTTWHGRYSMTGPNLTVTFPAQGGLAQPTFRWRLIAGRLVPVDWDRTVYGLAGLTLHLR